MSLYSFQSASPIHLRGGAAAWPAVEKWTPQFLVDAAGDASIKLMVSQTGRVRWATNGELINPGSDFVLEKIKLLEAAQWIQASEKGGPRYYIWQNSIDEICPNLFDDLKFDCRDPKKSTTNLWFGSRGNITALHFDSRDNIFLQVYGEKTFTLFSPDDTPHLYQHPPDATNRNLSYIDLSRPDHERFPELKRATPIYIKVIPGDLLFIPIGWWHYVVSDTLSISVNHWYRD